MQRSLAAWVRSVGRQQPSSAILAVIASTFFGTAAAQVAGPVAAYSFENGSGTVLADVTGHGNTLNLVNGPAWVAGRYGGALSFDGSNDRAVAAAYNSALNLAGRSLTLSAWINPRSNSTWQMIVLKPARATHTAPYFDWSMHRETSTGRIAAYFGCDGGQRTSTASTPLNTWTHVAVTYDGTSLRHYINGVLDRTTPVTCAVANTSSQPIRIGANAANGEVLNGLVDDVRVYNRVLSAAEILSDMSTSLGGAPAPDTTFPTVSISAPANGSTVSGTVTVTAGAADNVGVVGVQFQLDGANLGAEDLIAPYSTAWSTTSANNGSHTFTAVARDAAGNATTSSAITVSVANSVPVPTLGVTLTATPSSGIAPLLGVDLTSDVSGTATGPITYTFYCNRADTATTVLQPWDLQLVDSSQPSLTATDVCTYANPGAYVAKVIAQRGTLAAEARANVGVSAPPPVDTTPPSVAVTAPIGGSTVNGVVQLAANASDDFGVVGVRFLADGVNVGNELLSAPYGVSWDTTTVVDGAHTITAVARDAVGHSTQSSPVVITVGNVAALGPVAAYSFENGSGTVLADVTGHGNTLNLVNGPAWVAGRYGGALSFDGSNDRAVAAAYNSALNLAGRSLTLSAWINPRSNSTWQMIVLKPARATHTAPYFDWSMHSETSTGRIAAYFGCDGGQRTSTASTPLNTWTHVAVTYDGTSLRHYINGVLDRTTPVTCAVANTSSQPIRIGANAANGEVLNGLVDDVRVYNRVLSAAEILSDMSTSLGGAPAPDTTFPTVSISAPANGSTVSGTVTVTAGAADNVGVVGVQFQLDGANLGAEDLIAPYSTAWSTTSANNGSHTFTAVARDAAGNATTSSAITVSVANSVPVPTLGVTLTATPSSGIAPLLGVDLTSDVSGTATGPITYTFYCNRADTATTVLQPWDLQLVDSSQPSLTATDVCSYANPGAYVAKVIAQRGTLAAEARANVGVSSPTNPVELQLSASPPTVASAGTSSLTWSSFNADSCVADGAWSGAQPTSGSASTPPILGSSTFTLTCSGPGGSASSSATVTVEGAPVQTGLDFPSNGELPADAFVAFQFDNPQNNGLPLWGPSGQGATYLWKYRPRQQNGYYVTFWWSQADGFFNPENGYYGAHPYPHDGVTLPPLNSVGTHNWEIAVIGWDTQQTLAGTTKPVIKDVWYTQALRVVRNSADSKTLIFYTALPSTAPGDVIEYTITSPGYGEATPPTPKITFGDSPWYGGYQHERLSGVLRGIKIFNKALSEADVLAESASDSLVTAEGQSNVWYMNINPTPTDILDKSGNGRNPTWAGSERPRLWIGP